MLEQWHSFTDSNAFRRVTSQGPGRAFLKSRTFRSLNLTRNNVRTRAAVSRHPGTFDDVKTFCFFVGHNKSGASLLGGLLDAHPDVLLSDEVDALQYVAAGFSREQIFHMILKGSQAEARKGRVTARRLVPYSYWVPGGWQGRYRTPLVVGDSTTGTSTRRIASAPDLLARVERAASGAGVKALQVIRNPFDPISVMMVRGKRSFDNSIEHYFSACAALVGIRKRMGAQALLPVRYEGLVTDPEQKLAEVCRFLGIDPERNYLAACAQIVRKAPDRSRTMVEWSPERIRSVHQRIAEFDFLQGYTYDN